VNRVPRSSPSSVIKWSEDGKSILFVASDRGRTLIFKTAGSSVPGLSSRKQSQVGTFLSSSRGGPLRCTMADAVRPPDDLLRGQIKRASELSSFNDAYIWVVERC
jgi:hypothetical protein